MGCHTSHQEVSRVSPEEHLRNLFCMKAMEHIGKKLNPGFETKEQTLPDVARRIINPKKLIMVVLG